jgi:hypothetical protein
VRARRLAAVAAVGALAVGLSVASARVAGADEDQKRGPSLAALDVDLSSTEKTKPPSAAEWAAARPVKLTRVSPRAATCTALRVREWLRVRCPTSTFALSLLSGSIEGLSFWIGTEADNAFGEVQIPLRPGDRRVVQLWTSRPVDGGATAVDPYIVLQELWVEGEASPVVTLL